ncbi:hypothetical protein O0L34_g14465 [Tuta absoluta]|nr:hypothetical protein O0L34_g14465 [Tuta absoluta]
MLTFVISNGSASACYGESPLINTISVIVYLLHAIQPNEKQCPPFLIINFHHQVEGVEAAEEQERAPVASHWRSGAERASDGGARARLDAGGAHAGFLGGSPLSLLQGRACLPV